jgi:hypothetical protein
MASLALSFRYVSALAFGLSLLALSNSASAQLTAALILLIRLCAAPRFSGYHADQKMTLCDREFISLFEI